MSSISNHHIVKFKYLSVLLVSYTVIKLGKKNRELKVVDAYMNQVKMLTRVFLFLNASDYVRRTFFIAKIGIYTFLN